MTLGEYIKKMDDYCPHCGADIKLDERDCHEVKASACDNNEERE
ncbi:hypothetical protein ACNO5E_14240 [Vibrio parahaemolyticus]